MILIVTINNSHTYMVWRQGHHGSPPFSGITAMFQMSVQEFWNRWSRNWSIFSNNRSEVTDIVTPMYQYQRLVMELPCSFCIMAAVKWFRKPNT